ncbi:hypothetical protein COU18_03025 [Candidatus Kaiserbacteria bacterium CG10_big_fil_rev_8_21_14_0_10_51_14]|uniref:Uncharacterized protein n=1 Tax=Candidatus Kaiserbacteria bacterium CG10_big_fil_rev_8_21_14_0_10_51_14 TaxID=1974610 RepID=A0A2H0UBB6_9BACT|nr:MAG: hypothetical protein COU18_03025 [Candidatus Kaiserbacteria bacterium CG10_big_fil_rev_8_21_14_0_10_51_14]
MNIIRKSIAGITAVVLSLGFVLPVSALTVDTSGSVQGSGLGSVGATGAGVDINVDVGVGATTSGGGSQDGTTSTSGNASSNVNGNASVDANALLITRVDIDTGTVKATSAAPASVETRADLSGYVAAQMQSDANIASVETASDNVAVTYKQYARLFGFIPVTLDATATVQADGSVKVSYPWYAFLAVTNKADLETKLEQRVDAALSANAQLEASANASAEVTGSLSASEQAQVVQAVKTVMQAELDAALEARADASGSANVQ